MSKNYLVYGCDFDEEINIHFKHSEFAANLIFININDFLRAKEATQEDKVIVYGTKEEIKRIFEESFVYGFSIALIARAEQEFLRQTFEIPKDPIKALKVALRGEIKPVDLIYCQDKIVLWGALIGEAPPHGSLSSSVLKEGRSNKLKALFQGFKKITRLKKAQVTIKTHKEQEINTALTGIVILEHDNHSFASNLIEEFMSVSNGKVVALLISPSSVVEYLEYLYKAIFKRTKNLPKAAGVVLSERLEIESKPPLSVQIDAELYTQTPVVFDVHKKAVKLCASEEFWQKENFRQSDEKEVVKLGSLPVSKDALEYSKSRHIPFFTHADNKQYQELFTALREEARANSTFITLMILSTILATVGLFLNSASVIIGAMLLAPLMQPIVSFSMGLLRFDMDLFTHGLKSVIAGIALVLCASSLLALLLPFENITPEIAGRLHPSLLDLIVAIVSGIAAAYAKNNKKIIGSLAGVSIAVALVPPLSTAGIGIGWGDWSVFMNASLLFLTNFAGIAFAAALTFMVLGFSPVKRAKNGLLISLGIVLLISVPLYFSFSMMVKDARIKEALEKNSFIINSKRVILEKIYISHNRRDKKIYIRCDLISEAHFDKTERALLKTKILQKIKPFCEDKKVELETLERLRY